MHASLRLALPASSLFVAASVAFGAPQLAESATYVPSGTFGFGYSVAAQGNQALIGTPFESQHGQFAGAVYWWDTSTDQQIARLVAADAEPQRFFGWSVAMSADVLAVGAPGLTLSDPGAVYLFDAATGDQIAKLQAPDPNSTDRFGTDLAVEGSHLLVGAPGDNENGVFSGAGYLFDWTTGEFLRKFTVEDGNEDDALGTSVALDGPLALLGMPGDDTNLADSGAAVLFEAATGVLLRKLAPQDGEPNDRFGEAVALDGPRVAVGAPLNDVQGSRSGAVYLFDLVAGTELPLLPEVGVPFARFGASLELRGSQVLVGADGCGFRNDREGSAFVFDWESREQLFELQPTIGNLCNSFGLSLALSDQGVIVGARLQEINGFTSGAAFRFVVPECCVGLEYCQDQSCPCGNDDSLAGCRNSTMNGARLRGFGSASVGEDDLSLVATSLPPTQFGLFFMGMQPASTPFGDGLLCASGDVVRLSMPQPTEATGRLMLGPGLVSMACALGPSACIEAGATRYFQGWYRDPAGPCASGWNTTQGLEIAFVP